VPHDLHNVASYIILLVQEYNAKLFVASRKTAL